MGRHAATLRTVRPQPPLCFAPRMLACLHERGGQAVQRVPACLLDPRGQAPGRRHRALALVDRRRCASRLRRYEPAVGSAWPQGRMNMTTQGVAHLYLETHNWGKSVAFWEALGYKLEVEADHHSGQLVAPNGTKVFIAAPRPIDPTRRHLFRPLATGGRHPPHNGASRF